MRKDLSNGLKSLSSILTLTSQVFSAVADHSRAFRKPFSQKSKKKFFSIQTEASSTYTQVKSPFHYVDSKKSMGVMTGTNPEGMSQSCECELVNSF